MEGYELEGKRCVIVNETSFFRNEEGIIDFFDGELYHVMLDGGIDTFAFEREDFDVLDEKKVHENKENESTVNETTVNESTENESTLKESTVNKTTINETVNFSNKILSKQELIAAINKAFPDDESAAASITTTVALDGAKMQSICLNRFLDFEDF